MQGLPLGMESVGAEKSPSCNLAFYVSLIFLTMRMY